MIFMNQNVMRPTSVGNNGVSSLTGGILKKDKNKAGGM
jgi:hypothetical protein